MEKWVNLRHEDLTEETKTLISSLPSEKAYLGRNLCKYQGSWYYYNFLQGVLNFQRGFKPQDTDIIVASYPKSGTCGSRHSLSRFLREQRTLLMMIL